MGLQQQCGKYSFCNILIRADASIQIGTGHVMRCLALAQAWQETGGQVFLLTATLPTPLQTRLEAEELIIIPLSAAPGSIADALATVELARQHSVSWIVVDGYHFDAAYQQHMKDAGLRLLYIDDCGYAGHYPADLVLNQNIFATDALYASRAADTRLLLGSRYVLLRREFRAWRNWQRDIPTLATKLLVTLGGSDPDNVTLKVIQALQQVRTEPLEVVVLVGGGNPHTALLQASVDAGLHSITLKSNVHNMPEMIAWADVVLSAGGSTCWELAFLGAPMLLLALADNQRPIVEHLDACGAAVNLGWFTNIDPRKIVDALQELLFDSTIRTKMSDEGHRLIDGRGAERVVAFLSETDK